MLFKKSQWLIMLNNHDLNIGKVIVIMVYNLKVLKETNFWQFSSASVALNAISVNQFESEPDVCKLC